jgi:hypothetical protein
VFCLKLCHKNETFYRRLNNRLEKEIDYVNKASFGALKRHYDTLARLRVVLSDREAWGYLSIGVLVSALFSDHYQDEHGIWN